MSADQDLRRIQLEFIAMPGLRLTLAQAQRLWALDRATCETLLGTLVTGKFLVRTREGAYARSDPRWPDPKPAKADLSNRAASLKNAS